MPAPFYQKDPGYRSDDGMMYCVLDPKITEEDEVYVYLPEILSGACHAYRHIVEVENIYQCTARNGDQVFVVVFESFSLFEERIQ